jgi:RNA polymerase sigma-32 factor
LIQFVEDPQVGPDLRLAEAEIKKEFIERLDHFEKSLAGKELVIFRERLRAEQPKTLQEIGEAYGITRERVRQLEARVMEKLKEYMKQNAKFLSDSHST